MTPAYPGKEIASSTPLQLGAKHLTIPHSIRAPVMTYTPRQTDAVASSSPDVETGGMSRRQFISSLLVAGLCPFPLIGCSRGYKTLSETVCKVAHMPPAGQLIKTLDGGYAFPENTIVEKNLYKGLVAEGDIYTGLVKLNGAGEQEWHCQMKYELGNLELPGLLQTRNGDFYLLGNVGKPEPVQDLWPQPMLESSTYPAIVKINAAGQRVPYKVQSTLTPISDGRITYGIEVEDGLVFFGLKRKELPNVPNLDKYNKAFSPWIFKINHQGEMVWEYLVQTDDGKLVQEPEEVYSSFAKPLVEADGTIVVATVVSNLYLNPEKKLYETLTLANEQDPHAIILRFNSDGKELARGRIPKRGVNSLLPGKNGGFQVFWGSNSFNESESGIFHILLDKDIQFESEKFIPFKDFNAFVVVPATKPDEFYILGDTIKPGGNRTNATVIYLDQFMRITHQLRYGRETYPCAMVAGNAPNEVALVYQPQGDGGAGDAHFVRLQMVG
jgi:hypothetical protein